LQEAFRRRAEGKETSSDRELLRHIAQSHPFCGRTDD